MSRTKKSKPGTGKQESKAGALKPTKLAATKSEPKLEITSRAKKDPSKCFLLDKLSAELRNQLWREVLVSATCTLVSDDEPHQPALLRVCRQIRFEATAIFFKESYFLLPVDGYDSTPGYKWCKLAAPHLLGDALCNVD